jgi:copper(I)-binding protein
MKLKQLAVVGLIASALALSGCGAMSTAVKKRNLDVKTQMSETIWLEPSSEKTVYLQIRNTSDKDMSGLQTKSQMNLPPKATACPALRTQPTTGFRQTC